MTSPPDALLDRLIAEPDDIELRLVYADWLQTRNDPHGELIALQCQAAKSDAMHERERALIGQLEAELLRGLRPEYVELIWQGGFVRRVVIDSRMTEAIDRDDWLASHRCLALLRELAVSGLKQPGIASIPIAMLLRAPAAAMLTAVEIGGRLSEPPSADELGALFAGLPRLRALAIDGRSPPELSSIVACDRLEELVLWAPVDESQLIELADARWPALRRLVLSGRRLFGDPLAVLRAFDGERRATLEHLGVMETDPSVLVTALPRLPAFARLRSIALTWERLTSEASAALEQLRPTYDHIQLAYPVRAGQRLTGNQAYWLGFALRRRLGRSSDALPFYELACDRDPKNAEHWFAYGNAQGDVEQCDGQLAAYDRAIAIKPRDARFWNRRAYALKQADRLADARDSFAQAVDCDPKHADAWNNLGLVEWTLGRPALAQRCFERTLEIAPQNPYAGKNLVNLLIDLELGEQALAAARTMPRPDPPHDRGLVYAEARALLALRQRDAALELVNRMLAGAGNDERALSLAGCALRDLARYDEAIAAYDQLARATTCPAWLMFAWTAQAEITREPELLDRLAPPSVLDPSLVIADLVAHENLGRSELVVADPATRPADQIYCGLLAIAAALIAARPDDAQARYRALLDALDRRGPRYLVSTWPDLADLARHIAPAIGDDGARLLGGAYGVATGSAPRPAASYETAGA